MDATNSSDFPKRVQQKPTAGYALERELGRGGMATVHLAHDIRHDRRVAIKVLDAEVAAMVGAERFVREIHVMAHLQHPHILGLLDSGVFGSEGGELAGRPYYVMPYVQGGSLRARLEREGQLPVHDAVRIVSEVASALDYAHRHGVVHRDIKPENILLQDGSALVADFGIALAIEQAGGPRLTQTGLSLGTPQYMAPEQAAGQRSITAGADIYALGVMLYELLIGEPPFTGPTAQVIVARAMTDAPRSLAAQRPSIPAHVDAAVCRALEKLSADRFTSAREFAAALTEPVVAPGAGAGSTVTHAPPQATRGRLRDPVVLGFAVAAVVGGSAAAWLWMRAYAAPVAPSVRFVLGQLSASVVSSSATLSPNGENVVFSQPGSGLLVRSLGALVARPLAGTEMATHPFISPDGRWIGFFTAQDKLGKVPTDGSAPPVMLAPASRFSNGSWSADGVIVADRPRGGLVRFDAATGANRPLTAIDTARGERGHVHPRVLPDAKSVVFTVARGPAETTRALELAVVPLDNAATAASAHTLLGVSGSFAVALVDDWLVYGALDRSGLMAVRFDANHRRAMGTPVEVLHEPEGGVQDAVLASNGTLVYTRRMSSGDLVLVDAHGGARTLVSDTALGGRGYMYPRVSPDGQRIAAVGRAASGQTKVWVYEFGPGTRTQFSMGGEWLDVDWAPDSRRILFSAGAGHAFWLQSIDARAPPEKVAEVSGAFAGAFTPGGRALVFQRKVSGVWGIWSVALSGDRAPTPILTGPYTFYMPAVSPNERWLAYVSNESGREEVYVRPFPGPGVAVQVSEKGGTEPAWAPNGQRLFYRTGRDMLAATISDTAGFTVTTRESLFRDSFVGDMPHTNYAVYAGEGGRADGDRFIMFGTAAETRPDAVVVVNWLPELRAALAGARGSRSR